MRQLLIWNREKSERGGCSRRRVGRCPRDHVTLTLAASSTPPARRWAVTRSRRAASSTRLMVRATVCACSTCRSTIRSETPRRSSRRTSDSMEVRLLLRHVVQHVACWSLPQKCIDDNNCGSFSRLAGMHETSASTQGPDPPSGASGSHADGMPLPRIARYAQAREGPLLFRLNPCTCARDARTDR